MGAVRLLVAYAPPSAVMRTLHPPMTTPASEEWGALMSAAQAGNGGAYRRLLGELQRWLARYYAQRLPHPDIDDSVQDALVAIHQKRHTYDASRPFKPWLTAVARYKWVDRLRAMSRSTTESLPPDIAVHDHESAVTSAVILRELLAALQPAQAEVIILVKIEGFSIEEASARTGSRRRW